MSYMQLAVAVLVAQRPTTQWVEVQSEEMAPLAALLNTPDVSQLVEAQLEEMALDLCSTHRRRTVLPILAVVAVAPTTELLAVAVQELSLFAIHFLQHHSIRQSQLSLAHLARVQRCQRRQARGRGRQRRMHTNGNVQRLQVAHTQTLPQRQVVRMLCPILMLAISSRCL
jgi:hypothetical protein